MDRYDEEIQFACQVQGVTELVHFTPAQNLRSIFTHGLLPRKTLEQKGMPYQWTDPTRRDRRPECNCLSISFPNSPMFCSRLHDHRGWSWVVLSIDPGVLRDMDEFCICNASSEFERERDPMERRGAPGMWRMFQDVLIRGKYFRREDLRQLGLPECFPTHNQAEVLVTGSIAPEAIRRVSLANSRERDALIGQPWAAPQLAGVDVVIGPELFGPRIDDSFWTARRA